MSPEEQETGNETLITYLLSLLGVSTIEGDGKELHFMAVDQYITDNLGKYSYGEIKYAFNMLLKGEFKHLKGFEDYRVFNKLDCILLAKVIEGYDIMKRIILSHYNNSVKRNIILLEEKKNELSEEEKLKIVNEGICNCFNHYKNTGEVETGRMYIFYVLDERGFFDKSNDYRNGVIEIIKERIKNKKEIEKKQPEKRGLKKALQVLKNMNDGGKTMGAFVKPSEYDIKDMARMYVMTEYFDLLILNKIDIIDKL